MTRSILSNDTKWDGFAFVTVKQALFRFTTPQQGFSEARGFKLTQSVPQGPEPVDLEEGLRRVKHLLPSR
jgi:hypothetical protein